MIDTKDKSIEAIMKRIADSLKGMGNLQLVYDRLTGFSGFYILDNNTAHKAMKTKSKQSRMVKVKLGD